MYSYGMQSTARRCREESKARMRERNESQEGRSGASKWRLHKSRLSFQAVAKIGKLEASTGLGR